VAAVDPCEQSKIKVRQEDGETKLQLNDTGPLTGKQGRCGQFRLAFPLRRLGSVEMNDDMSGVSRMFSCLFSFYITAILQY